MERVRSKGERERKRRKRKKGRRGLLVVGREEAEEESSWRGEARLSLLGHLLIFLGERKPFIVLKVKLFRVTLVKIRSATVPRGRNCLPDELNSETPPQQLRAQAQALALLPLTVIASRLDFLDRYPSFVSPFPYIRIYPLSSELSCPSPMHPRNPYFLLPPDFAALAASSVGEELRPL